MTGHEVEASITVEVEEPNEVPVIVKVDAADATEVTTGEEAVR